jgi:hypothetical protein
MCAKSRLACPSGVPEAHPLRRGREAAMAVRCPMCPGVMIEHCECPSCTWLRCDNPRCAADVLDLATGRLRHTSGAVVNGDA